MLCESCQKRESCRKLCDAAESYTNQDYVPQKEKPIGTPNPHPWPIQVSNIYLTAKERRIVTLLGQGLTRKDVAQLCGISMGNLRVMLFRLNRKL